MLFKIPVDWVNWPLDKIYIKANEFQFDFYLILAIIACESGGNQYATRCEPNFPYVKNINIALWCSKLKATDITVRTLMATSFGLMQVMGTTARDLGLLDTDNPWPTSLFDVEKNLHFGLKYLARKRQEYGPDDLKKLYAAYNAGTPRPYSRDKGEVTYANQGAVNRFYQQYKKACGEDRYSIYKKVKIVNIGV